MPDHRAVERFLSPLPVQAVHGIGPAQAAALQRYGLHTVGALAAVGETVVCRILGGKAGRVLPPGPRHRPSRRNRGPHARIDQRLPRLRCQHLRPLRAALLDLVVTLANKNLISRLLNTPESHSAPAVCSVPPGRLSPTGCAESTLRAI
ncbi:hypothetical protein [Streptomyces sp. NPDC127114]|uniref:hypothetical protein n=1 Tax=Streptomyces sp. NPDC127114 TaxID=3345366 RepID=UPI0036327F64